jgi:type II secretory pathway component GspD/PulD (secretin)
MALAVALLVGAAEAMAQDAGQPSLGQKYKNALNLYEQGDYAGAKVLLLEVKDGVKGEKLNPAVEQEINRRLEMIDAKLSAAPAVDTAVAPAVSTDDETRRSAAAGKFARAQGLMRAQNYQGALDLFASAKSDIDAIPAEKVAASDRVALDANIAACKDALSKGTMVADARTTSPREGTAYQVATPAVGAAATGPAEVPPAGSIFQDEVEKDRVRVQLEVQEIKTKLADGRVFMNERDFRRAEQKYQAALLQVKYGDFEAAFKKTWLAVIQQEMDLLEATRAADDKNSREKVNVEAAAEIDRQNKETQREQAMMKQRLAEEFSTFYGRGQFDEALVILEQMKRLDPEDASITEKIKTTTLKKLEAWRADAVKERYLQTQMHLTQAQEDMTPWYPVTKYPDNWKELSDRRLRAVQRQQVQEKPQDRAVRRKLEETPVSFTFADQSVAEAINFLQEVSKVNIVVDRAKIPEGKTVTLKLGDVSLETALNLLSEQIELKWVIRDGVVRISDAEGVKQRPEINTYDVGDLLADVPNFQGPTFELQNISSNRGGSGSGSSIFSDSESGKGSTTEETTKSAEESLQDLITLVKEVIDPTSWDEGSGNAIRGRAGSIIVTHSPDTQQKVQKLLDDLRKTRALQVCIDIRFITIDDRFLESIGVDLTGTNNAAASDPSYNLQLQGDPTIVRTAGIEYDRTIQGGKWSALGAAANTLATATSLAGEYPLSGSGGLTLATSFLDDVEVNMILSAIQQSRRALQMKSPKLTMMNGQRAYIAVSKQRNFVQDVSVDVSEGAVGYDPDIGTVQDGIVFDVRPTVSADRRYVQMDLRPSVATIDQMDEFETVTAGIFGGARIQLPRIGVQVVRTTVSVPDGGTLMIGGLSYAFDSEEESGLPILSKIPLLGKLFSRRGFTTQRYNIVILVKPTIIIQEEREAEIN